MTASFLWSNFGVTQIANIGGMFPKNSTVLSGFVLFSSQSNLAELGVFCLVGVGCGLLFFVFARFFSPFSGFWWLFCFGVALAMGVGTAVGILLIFPARINYQSFLIPLLSFFALLRLLYFKRG